MTRQDYTILTPFWHGGLLIRPEDQATIALYPKVAEHHLRNGTLKAVSNAVEEPVPAPMAEAEPGGKGRKG